MKEAIFLSASVPDPSRSPHYAENSDTVAITSAVSALVHVVLGRRMLVFGGHPAITPMIWIMADKIGVDFSKWVHLYQSYFFEDVFPEENSKFNNVTFTEKFEGDLPRSIKYMRERMFAENKFGAAVFIGGMNGIIDEYNLFKSYHPDAKIIPVLSTGGASLEIEPDEQNQIDDLTNDMNYVGLLHKYLNISVREDRFDIPSNQPINIEDRYWKRRGGNDVL